MINLKSLVIGYSLIQFHTLDDCILLLLSNVKLEALLIKVDTYKVVIMLLKFLVLNAVSNPLEAVNVSLVEVCKGVLSPIALKLVSK